MQTECYRRGSVGVQKRADSQTVQASGRQDYPGSISDEVWFLTGQEKFCNNREQKNKGLLGNQDNTMFTKLLCFFKKIVIWDGAHDSWRRINGYEGKEVVWALNADSLKCHTSECSFS